MSYSKYSWYGISYNIPTSVAYEYGLILVRNDPNYFKFYGNILDHVMAVYFRKKAQITDIGVFLTCLKQWAYWGGSFEMSGLSFRLEYI
jgi:hypothetical protein